MKKVILVTSHFPYLPGEQFLETEIKYWGKEPNIDMTLMPMARGEQRRAVPKHISLDERLTKKPRKMEKIFLVLRAFFSPLFYRVLYKEVLHEPRRFYKALFSYAVYLFYRKKFLNYLKSNRDKPPVFYTYWYTEATYALQSLKKRYEFKLITRVHRFDLYEERRKHAYMPLRREFLEDIDKIYVVTESAKDYLVKQYGFKAVQIETARLGVEDRDIVTSPSGENFFHIVSCSFITEVKRLDKLIEAVAKLARQYDKMEIKWTHIGRGESEKRIKAYAKQILGKIRNVEYTFLGELENDEVYVFYKKNRIDVFVNTSESEGVPVSIMEAMSCRIPVVAPDVGGIREMIENEKSGVLLSANAEIDEIAGALRRVDFFKEPKIRRRNYEIFKKKYDADKNYPEFIRMIETDFQ
jgi:glycosyltransferase involved in cell wall biosynthesis